MAPALRSPASLHGPPTAHMIAVMLEWLSVLPRKQRVIAEGASLFHRGDRIRTMFVVEAGSITLTRYSSTGASLVLQRAGPGSVVAEASLFATAYHCDATANADTTVLAVPRADFLRQLDTSPQFARAWAMHLSHEVRNARSRAEILSLRTVAERLDAWLADNGELPDRGRWKGVAAELGASPEALYREMARRRSMLASPTRKR